MVAVFDPRKFERYALGLTIESRDVGLVRFKMRKAQVRVLRGITEALEEDRRTVVVLKCRQIGLSTLGLALDLYWAKEHPGMHGALITDTDSNRESFRVTLDSMLGEQEKGDKKVRHNREHLVFPNRSRLIYQVAGVKQGGTLARGKGLNYCHGTEVSSWGDANALDSLIASFSQKHPNRLYMFESTARGFNMFYDMCRTAQRSRSQSFVFATWWHTDEFQFAPGSGEYRVFSKEPPSPTEAEWMRAVKLIYKHDITKGQLAWWRWMIEDQGFTPENMQEEYPCTHETAFLMTGAQFFSTPSLTKLMLATRGLKGQEFSYSYGRKYEELERRKSQYTEPQLVIWEAPVSGAYYVIGADPCGGAGTASSDEGVIEVLRCYGDGVDQVAEFRVAGIPGYCFAWVLASLTQEYQPCLVNLEINGAGIAVADELSRIEFSGSYYVYRRIDSLGSGGALHWRMNQENKRWIFEQMRTMVERDMIAIRSQEAVAQMRKIEQAGMFVGGASNATGDDCVVGLALAIEAWTKNFMEMLRAEGVKRPVRDERGRVEEHEPNILGGQIGAMLEGLGVRSKESGLETAYGERVFEGAGYEEF